MAEDRVVLITGASTGIGRATADLLAARGFAVFGTSRHPETYPLPANWELVQLDVCSDASVAHCIGEVPDRAGRLDVLVNNAAYGLDGALEEATLAQVKAQFETNYFGALRTIKAALPAMRAQGSGIIINISAGNATARLPFIGHYTATKCALEGFSEVLRQEVRPFGIHVSVIQPSFIRTNISETFELGADRVAAYEPARTAWLEMYKTNIRNGAEPVIIARIVLRIVQSRRPRFMYLAGPQMWLSTWGHRLLPEELLQWLYRTRLGVR